MIRTQYCTAAGLFPGSSGKMHLLIYQFQPQLGAGEKKQEHTVCDAKLLHTYQVYVGATPLLSDLFLRPPALACHQFFSHRRACMPLQQIRRGIQGEGEGKGYCHYPHCTWTSPPSPKDTYHTQRIREGRLLWPPPPWVRSCFTSA